jgi:hypothetical protein
MAAFADGLPHAPLREVAGYHDRCPQTLQILLPFQCVSVERLKEWRLYLDKNQTLVLKSEDIPRCLGNNLATIHGFLGVDFGR